MALADWTATAGDSVQAGDTLEVPVTFANKTTGDKVVQSFRYVTQSDLEESVRQAIKDRQSTGKLTPVPPGTSLSLVAPAVVPPPAPTVDEQLATDFASAWRTVKLLEEADRRKWGSAAQQSAVTAQLATALLNAQSLYTQKPAVCVPLMRAV
jgi:hypothetical protein